MGFLGDILGLPLDVVSDLLDEGDITLGGTRDTLEDIIDDLI